MIKVTDFPTDKYNRYPNLVKELIKATSVADRSEDNADQLLAVLNTVAKKYEKKAPVKTTKKTTT